MTTPKLEFGKVYVVEVAFKAENPIHRAICFNCKENGSSSYIIQLCSPGYGFIVIRCLNELAFFQVVCEVKEMDEAYPNRFKLPGEIK